MLLKSRIVRTSAALTFVSSFFIWDQIRRLKNNLNAATNPKILFYSQSKPQYIQINNPAVQALIIEKELGNLSDEMFRMAQFFLWIHSSIKCSYWYENLFSLRRIIAWKLLKLAQTESEYRGKAIEDLSRISGLSDSDAYQLAQACNANTAAILARSTHCDFRLILKPKNSYISDTTPLLRKLQHFFQRLDALSKHSCLHNFVSEHFTDDHKLFEDELSLKISSPKILLESVQVLLHHSWIDNNSNDIVNLGGFSLLYDIFQTAVTDSTEDLELVIGLSQLMSSLSINKNHAKSLYQSGWIGLLAKLIRHEDIRVSVPAARALINCDRDNSEHSYYGRNVYVLHPLLQSTVVPEVDIVLVHGLRGGVFVTWRQRTPELNRQKHDFILPLPKGKNIDEKLLELTDYELVLSDIPVDECCHGKKPLVIPQINDVTKEGKKSQCWPKDWLPKDLKASVRVIGVNYDTNLTMWTPKCPLVVSKKTFRDRSEHLAQVLIKAGLGSRPIIWLTHSMGGIIVKDLLVNCNNSDSSSHQSLVNMTKGIVFFSTPHKGSKLANLNKTSQFILWPTTEVQELRQDSKSLRELHEKFIKLVHDKQSISVLSLAERKPTFVRALNREFLFVDEESSNVGVGDLFGIPLDHLCICKPASRKSRFKIITEFFHHHHNHHRRNH